MSIPAGYLLRERGEFGGPGLPILTVVSEFGVRVRDLEAGGRAVGEDLNGYRRVRTGDLVVNRLWARFGAYGVSEFDGLISPAYWVLKPDASQVDGRYLHSLLRSSRYLAEIRRLSKDMPPNGFDLPWDLFKRVSIDLPSLEAQRSIADFLDRETTRIDAVIEKKRRLIELITMRTFQFASSVCSNTDDSDAENWQRVPLKSLFSFSKGKDAQRLNGEYVANHEGSYAVYSGQTSGDAVFGLIDSFDFDLPGGAILVATVGAEAMSCRIVTGRFSLSQNCALMIPRPGTKVVLPFILGQLRDLFIEKRAEIPDHMQPSLRIEDLNRFFVKVPSLEMQESIALLINEKWTSTSTLLKSLESQVEKLIERRSSLITDAVAGKVDIPGVAA
jgi:type I restriction enzyme S subunit